MHHLSRPARIIEGPWSTRGPLVRYVLASCLVVAAALLSVALSGLAGGRTFALFYVAVMVGTVLCGPGPGLLTVLLSSVTVYYLSAGRPDELMHAALFAVLAAVISLLLTAILAAKRRAEEAEETSRRSEEYYRSLVQNASDMIVLIDHAGNVLYESDSVEWMLGYKPHERVGKSIFDLVLAEDVPRLSAAFAGQGPEGPLEFRVRARDGSVRHLEAVGRDMMDDPKVGAVVVNVRDITGRKRAEDRLSETETRYRAMVERMPSITYTQRVDGDHAMTFVSPQVEDILGYTREDYLSRPKFEVSIVHPEDRERVRKQDEVTDATGEPFVCEYRALAKDGRVVWLHEEAVVVRDEEGNPLFWQGFMLDVTEQKLAEAERRENEERFRATFEQAAVGMAHVGLDGRWLRVNDKLCEILDYTAEEMLSGMTFQDVTHPDDLGADLAEVRRLLAGKTGTYAMEKRYRRKGGGMVWVNLTVSLVREPSGGPKYFISVIEDISRRKRSEWALRESEERFRALVQNSSDFIALCDPDNTIRYISPSVRDILGYGPEEMVGDPLPDYVHPADRAKAVFDVGRALVEPEVRAEAVRYRRKDGSHAHLEAVFSDKTSNPSVRGVVCNMRDVTEKIEAERELRRSVDLLITLRETGQALGATLDAEEICSGLIEASERVTELAAVRVEVWNEAGETVVTCSSEAPLPPDVPEIATARAEAAEKGEQQTFHVWNPEWMTGMCLPFTGHGRVIGFLEVYGTGALMDGRVSAILDSLANQAATALENARLYQELEERERRLQDLLAKLLSTQEEERRRVSYEVHDGLAQVAAAAHQHLQAFARRNAPERAEVRAELDLIVRLVRRTVTDARRIIANLRPTALDDFGLSAALALEVEGLREEGYEVEYDDGIGGQRLPDACEITLFRIAQESLANLRKHAGSKRARIGLSRQNGEVRLEVRDWGHGFDPEVVRAGSGPGERVGLAGMKERAGILGGTFEVESSREGTTVTATIPLDT